ncbi:MAG: ribonuclease P protein component [Actinomycetota bacterium]|nr:ribonuclease P protein component [Actinomycetota bacterium]
MSPSRLRRRNDIRAVLAARNVAHGADMVIHASRLPRSRCPAGSADDALRVAVVAGRRVGGAVQRNRAKRRLRAALASGPLPGGLDVVVVARHSVLGADFRSLQAELAGLVERVASRALAS